MNDLLPYYERELTFLRRHSREFAERYPKIASRLLLSGETCEDPHIERMLESFALLSARVHKKLDDDFPELTESLLGVIAPHYLKPLPSCSIARFDMGGADAQLSEPVSLPRGTSLSTRASGGVACRFRTAYDVTLAPIRIAAAGFEQPVISGRSLRVPPDTSCALTLTIESSSAANPLNALRLDRLRLFLDGEPSLVCHLREALFSSLRGIAVGSPEQNAWQVLNRDVVQPVGFGIDEGLLDYDARSQLAYRLLTEFFLFPAKFDFFDLDFAALRAALPPGTTRFEIKFFLGRGATELQPALLERVSSANFAMGCTPVVNLFERNAEPIRLDHSRTDYPLVVDARRAASFELYSVNRVSRVEKSARGERISEFRPFYGLRHAETPAGEGRYWHLRRDAQVASVSPGYEYEIALVDSTEDLEEERTETLSIEVTATNRDLPSQLPYGLPEGDLFIEGGSIARRIAFLRRPTPTYRFRTEDEGLWRLISHLSLNRLSLAENGLEALRETFGLYNASRAASNQRMLDGLKTIEHRPASAMLPGDPFPAFVRGVDIEIGVDEQAFVGVGLSLFTAVLEHFFALYVHLNSFTRLRVRSTRSGEVLIACKPRSGDVVLV
ncbi:type VI secretion system baseplate subunit TssF [Niveibacterium sp. 24ML]|uniref:type VI secretion system baseplate subunit TssF n=1 Tax=Niveibacterium sp. 24ML TaxID=2985512 RepID=UPI0022719EF4|nr:type VI secretion system baseplate subunit TssF [Niveibacterium sp. 24ML]MCX9154821.1 type VI secretion system baseplate subunit TssF [Niveibacterium sp. 24ML]